MVVKVFLAVLCYQLLMSHAWHMPFYKLRTPLVYNKLSAVKYEPPSVREYSRKDLSDRTQRELIEIIESQQREAKLNSIIKDLTDEISVKDKLISELNALKNSLERQLSRNKAEENLLENKVQSNLYQLGVTLDRMAIDLVFAYSMHGIRSFEHLVKFVEDPIEAEKQGYCVAGAASTWEECPNECVKEDVEELLEDCPNLLYAIKTLKSFGGSSADSEHYEPLTKKDVKIAMETIRSKSLLDESMEDVAEVVESVAMKHWELEREAAKEEEDEEEYYDDYDDEEDQDQVDDEDEDEDDYDEEEDEEEEGDLVGSDDEDDEDDYDDEDDDDDEDEKGAIRTEQDDDSDDYDDDDGEDDILLDGDEDDDENYEDDDDDDEYDDDDDDEYELDGDDSTEADGEEEAEGAEGAGKSDEEGEDAAPPAAAAPTDEETQPLPPSEDYIIRLF